MSAWVQQNHICSGLKTTWLFERWSNVHLVFKSWKMTVYRTMFYNSCNFVADLILHKIPNMALFNVIFLKCFFIWHRTVYTVWYKVWFNLYIIFNNWPWVVVVLLQFIIVLYTQTTFLYISPYPTISTLPGSITSKNALAKDKLEHKINSTSG